MKGLKLTTEEQDTIRDMHAEGYNDHEIAEQLDRTARSIYLYRKRMGLPALPQRCRKRVADLVAKMHDRGMIDREIAQRLSRGCEITSLQVGVIRRSLGRPPIKRGPSGAQRRKAAMESNAYEKYRCRQLKSDAEIAALYRGLSYA